LSIKISFKLLFLFSEAVASKFFTSGKKHCPIFYRQDFDFLVAFFTSEKIFTNINYLRK